MLWNIKKRTASKTEPIAKLLDMLIKIHMENHGTFSRMCHNFEGEICKKLDNAGLDAVHTAKGVVIKKQRITDTF